MLLLLGSIKMLEPIARNLYENLVLGHGVRLKGKILDVGCRDGRYFEMLKELGGEEIYGVDPDLQPRALESPFVDKNNLYKRNVEDLPNVLYGNFNYLTIFSLFLGTPSPENCRNIARAFNNLIIEDGSFLATFTSRDELQIWKPYFDETFIGISEPLINTQLTDPNVIRYLEDSRRNPRVILKPAKYGLNDIINPRDLLKYSGMFLYIGIK